MIELFSYWKATASPEIIVKADSLNTAQIAWWKDLLLKGMGQYFYENTIDFTKPNFLTIKSLAKPSYPLLDLAKDRRELKERVLVPIGGGKDALVTWEILKGAKRKTTAFVLNPTNVHRQIYKVGEMKNPLIAERTIDPALLSLNRDGYLNGHTPFSAYLAFLTVLTAVLKDYKYIAISQERSSNEGNVEYLGSIINHQYSKSYDFEKRFRQYSKKYLSAKVEYFSFLRPLYELQIAQLFSAYPKYFPVFLSCNEAFKTDSGRRQGTGKWCNNCSKCLFTYLILSPFLTEKELNKIFKENLLEKPSIAPILQQLTGEGSFKPFECVGTAKECKAASTKKGLEEILKSWNSKHFLPTELENILKKASLSS